MQLDLVYGRLAFNAYNNVYALLCPKSLLVPIASSVEINGHREPVCYVLSLLR
jgi:hypothetical protein